MCSINCASTLQQRTVAYSLSLLYYSQFLASKGAQDFVQFSFTVLFFNNHSAEKDNVLFVLLSFFTLLKEEEQPK